MDKFTTVKKRQAREIEAEKATKVYEGENLTVIKKNDKEFIISQDKLFILPYFVYDASIFMSVENIESYKFKFENKNDRFLTTIGDYIDEKDTINQNVRTILFNKLGIALNEFYKPEVEGPFFASKDSTSQYYTCLLELNYNDYKQIIIQDKDQKTIKIELHDLDNINIYDMTSLYLISKLKNETKI